MQQRDPFNELQSARAFICATQDSEHRADAVAKAQVTSQLHAASLSALILYALAPDGSTGLLFRQTAPNHACQLWPTCHGRKGRELVHEDDTFFLTQLQPAARLPVGLSASLQVWLHFKLSQDFFLSFKSRGQRAVFKLETNKKRFSLMTVGLSNPLSARIRRCFALFEPNVEGTNQPIHF